MFRLGGDLGNSDDAIRQIDFTEDERLMKEELDSTENSFRKLTNDVFRTMESFNDPRAMGIPVNSWDEIASMPVGDEQSQEPEQVEEVEEEVVDIKKGETEGKEPPKPKTDKENKNNIN